jgi:hypothetical protein
MDEWQSHIGVVPDLSRQRWGLQTRAYSEAGKSEPLEARLKARIKPTTLARLNLYTKDYHYGFPLLDEAVNEALHDFLVKMGY